MADNKPSCLFEAVNSNEENALDRFKRSLHCRKQKSENHAKSCITSCELPEEAIKNQDLTLLQEFLRVMTSMNMSPEYYKYQNRALVQKAVSQPKVNLEILTELIRHMGGCSVNKYTSCPLVSALKMERSGENHWHTIRILLNTGADATLRGSYGEQSLCVYLQTLKCHFDETNWSSIIDLLLSHGCQIDHEDYRGATPLQAFLYWGIPSTGKKVKPPKMTEDQALLVVDKLLNLGANARAQDKCEHTLLHSAVSAVNVRVCKRLIEAGADGNVNSSGEGNAFYGLWGLDFPVSSKKMTSTLTELIHVLRHDGKVDINIKTADGSTVIHKAALLSGVKMVEILIDNGADVMQTDGVLNTVLHYAVLNEDKDVLEFFIHGKQLNVNARNINGFTPLHYAGFYDDEIAAGALLEAGANIHAQGQHGLRVLHLATTAGDANNDIALCLPRLLLHGLDLNMTDDYGCTALYYSLFQQNKPYIDALRHSGASTISPVIDISEIKSNIPYGYIASTELRRNWHKPSTEELVKKGEKLTTLDELGTHTAMMKAVFGTNLWHKSTNIDFLNAIVIPVVDCEEAENILVRQTVEQFVQSVTDAIYQLNPLFQGRLITSGSSYEGVKTHLPNEFDYMIELVNFSNIILSFEQSIHTGFVTVKGAPKDYADQMKTFLTDGNELNSNIILTQYKKLLEKALHVTYTKGWKHIIKYPGDMESTTAPMIGANHNTLANHKLMWISDTYKMMRISIDINPVIFMSNWPSFCRADSLLINKICGKGIYLIPKQPHMSVVDEQNDKEGFEDVRLWRLSFSHLETEIIQESEMRMALLLAKAMRMQPVSPKLTSDPNRRPDNTGVDDLITSRSQIIPEDSSSESEEFSNLSEDSEETEPDVQEVDAEDVIQTYYLKQLFFTINDEIKRKNRRTTMVELTRKVYARLIESIENQTLESYFVPGQNIYSVPDDIGIQITSKIPFHAAAQLALCRHILSVLSE